MTRILVTGGTGYVASWCIAGLLAQGHAVRTTLRSLDKADRVRVALEDAGHDVTGLSFVEADLIDDSGWADAMAGCEHVLHVASPLGHSGQQTREALVPPARDGTLRVLKAATAAGVKRIVMTSAAATARPSSHDGGPARETVWADPDAPNLDPYRLSKILAERAAWDFMTHQRGATTLTTILPGAVLGPLLSADTVGSVQVVQRMLRGQPPALPNLGFSITDVRDLADMHIRALTAPEAPGQRFLVGGQFLWMREIADLLRDGLGADAKRIPHRRMPDAVFRLFALFISDLRMFKADLGRRNEMDTAKARQLLGFAPKAAETTLLDCARNLVALGLA
jgi:dihydroflavonol-4-reductase